MTEEKTIEIRKQFARYCWKHMNIFQKMKWRFSCKLWEEDWVKSVEIQELKKQLEQANEIIQEAVFQNICYNCDFGINHCDQCRNGTLRKQAKNLLEGVAE